MSGRGDCERFAALGARQIDSEHALDAEQAQFVTAHLRDCPDCSLEQSILNEISAWKDRSVTDQLSDAVIAQRARALLARDREAASGARAASWLPRTWFSSWTSTWKLAGASALVVALGLLAVVWIAVRDGTPPASGEGQVWLSLAAGEVTLNNRTVSAGASIPGEGVLELGRGKAVLGFASGSKAVVTEGSRVAVSARGAKQRVRLERGSALFRVARAKVRQPFVVQTPSGQVQVMGTAFRVEERSAGCEVSVLEGRVRFVAPNRPPQLIGAGQKRTAGGRIESLSATGQDAMARDLDLADALPPGQGSRLVVRTVPSRVSVWLDGRLLGKTPLSASVPPGRHQLRLSVVGHDAIDQPITVPKDEAVLVERTLATLAATASDAGSDASDAGSDASDAGSVDASISSTGARRRQTKGRPNQPTTVQSLVDAIGDHRADRDWRAVVRGYRQLIRTFPDSPEACTCRVPLGQVLLRRLNRPTQALGAFRGYLAADPNGPLAAEARWGEISALDRLGRETETIEAGREFLRRHRGSIYTSRVRRLLRKHGDTAAR